MKIFGHPWIESEDFYKISLMEEIKFTPSNSVLHLKTLSFSLSLAKYCQQNHLAYMVEVETIKDAIFANSLNAKYILVSKELATELMPIAQNYLFDTQVLATIFDENEIEEMAKQGIDGIFLNKK